MTTLENVDMGGAVSLLQKLFEHAQSDLKQISRKIEQQFVSDFQQIGNGKANPRRMLRRLDELANRVEMLRQRSETIKEAKENIAVKSMKLSHETQSGIQKLAHLTAMLSINTNKAFEPDMATLQGFCENNNDTGNTTFDITITNSGNMTQESEAPAAHLEVTKKPISASRFMYNPVTMKEFENVSDLVKGRAKLDDINKVYQILYDHFVQAHKRSKFQTVLPLSVKDMTEMGLKITGQTGEARIKVLRSLKRLTISKKGVLMSFKEE
eukprot:m.35395 g.35395  ORF g.35395 m.35395 type:complete len:268 (-) comp6600_c0_seq1:365-1168(-)